jgi:DNA-binding transcriptional LysR family regulator
MRHLVNGGFRAHAVRSRRHGAGRAALELAVSQPVVSKAMSELEHALGFRLLDRSQQGVEPTRYGRAVVKWGIAAFDDLR